VTAKFLVALLVAWLGWRLWHGLVRGPEKRAPAARPGDGREVANARGLLGVGAAADAGEIRAAHRRLVASAHPDHGGSEAETVRLNAARDLLLAQARTANSEAM